jgi:hypothetical protein
MTITKNNIMAINEETKDIIYGDDLYELMKDLDKKYHGSHFRIEILNPEQRLLMK